MHTKRRRRRFGSSAAALFNAIFMKDSAVCLRSVSYTHLQQPVARDLRQVSAALKMITDMERIGDQAADIADIVKVTSLDVPDASIRLKDMAKATASMVTKCIDAYVKQDLNLAREVIDSDDIVDDLFDEVKDEILQGMRKGITTDVQSLDYLMIAKYYERIGDHATNIAEWVVYSINGHHKGE